ncbi:unnamed protein product [Rotaria socialis]
MINNVNRQSLNSINSGLHIKERILQRLAIGSAHINQFERKFQEALGKQKDAAAIPVITDDIREPKDVASTEEID